MKQVDSSLTEKLQTVLIPYYYSHASARYDYNPWTVSLGWNTLFVKVMYFYYDLEENTYY